MPKSVKESAAQLELAHLDREKNLTRLAYAAMVVLGINVGWLGPFLPQIAYGINASLDRTGLILSAIALGYFVALPAGGEFGHRRGPHFLLIVATAMDAVGFGWLAVASSLPASICAAVLIGFAQCGIDVAVNALVAELNRDRLAAALNYLHMMFGVGATMGPAIDGLAMARGISYRLTFTAGAAAIAMLAVTLAATPRMKSPSPPVDGEKHDLRALLMHRLIWAIALVLFLYVGAEVGVGAWLYSYLRHGAVPVAISVASAGVSIYWAGLIGGRLLGGMLAHRVPPLRLAAIGSLIAAAGLLSLMFTGSVPMLSFPIVAIVGVGFGPIFPNMIAAGAERFPSRVASMTSIVAGGAALGGSAVPWAMGLALVMSGRAASIGIAFAATVAMLAVLASMDLSRSQCLS